MNKGGSLQSLLRLPFAAVLLSLVLLGASCTTQRIQTVNEETDANRILDVLLSYGIRSTKVVVGDGSEQTFEVHIYGGEEEYRAAIQLMDDHCLPQPKPPVVEGSEIVTSMQVEKARELRRIKINTESLLRNIPGTTCVSVNLVEPEGSAISFNPYPASATVLIRYKSAKIDMTPPQIAKMVSRSVPGLSPDKVFVSLTYSPIRPLPNFDRDRNLKRALWVAGIGLATILLFVAIAWTIRKRSVNRRIKEMAALEEAEFENQTARDVLASGSSQAYDLSEPD